MNKRCIQRVDPSAHTGAHTQHTHTDLQTGILREAGTEKESCRQKSADGGGKHGQNLTIQRRQGGQSGSGDIGTTGGEAQSGLCTPNPGSCRKNPLLVCHALQFVDDFRSSLHI